MFNVGDVVVTKKPLWFNGVDVGNMLGVVIDIKGHILIEIAGHNDNPVRCFRNDIEKVEKEENAGFKDDDDTAEFDVSKWLYVP